MTNAFDRIIDLDEVRGTNTDSKVERRQEPKK